MELCAIRYITLVLFLYFSPKITLDLLQGSCPNFWLRSWKRWYGGQGRTTKPPVQTISPVRSGALCTIQRGFQHVPEDRYFPRVLEACPLSTIPQFWEVRKDTFLISVAMSLRQRWDNFGNIAGEPYENDHGQLRNRAIRVAVWFQKGTVHR